MCLPTRKSKLSDSKETPASIVSLPPASPRTSATGKRRSNQTLEIPNPKPSVSSLSSTSPDRKSREEKRLPMPRKTPGGLPQDPVILGAPSHRNEAAEQTDTNNYGYNPPHISEASNNSNSAMFGSMNAAAGVAIMTGGGDGGYSGF